MASKIQGITVEIGGDTTKLGNALESVNKKSKSLQNELKGVNTLLKMDPSNVTLLRQKQDLLNQSIAECREKLNTLKATQAQVQAQFDKGEITAEQYRDFQREIVATENKLNKLQKEAKNFGSVGAQQVAVVGTKMQDLGNKVTAVGQKFKVISAVASTALVGITASAINFETAFTGVTKTVDGTDEQLENIKQGILDLSEATASSATDIAGVAEAAGQLGVKTENIMAFTETMVRLGDSTNISASDAATAIAQLYNVMGADINTVDQFGAALVALGNNAATSENDIMNMASRIASSGKQVGLTEQQVLALATSLASVGLEAEGGGSAISAVITEIDKSVALNSDSLKTWASVAGMSVKEFKQLWQNDAMTAIQAVTKGMGDAKAGGQNLNVILDNLGVTSLRQTDTMKRLSGASELMSNMVQISNEAWSENTALTNESEKRYQTTAAKMQQLKNTVQELCVKLGEILLPIIQSVCDSLSNFASWLTGLSPTAQKVVLVVIAIVAAIGPLIIFIGKLISSIGTIMTIVPKVVSAFKAIKTAMAALNAVMLANPISLVIIAIVALVAIFVVLWNKCEWFRNFWIGLWEKIKNAVSQAVENIKKFLDNMKTVIDGVKNNISIFFENIKNFISQVANNIKNFIESVKLVLSTIVTFIDTNVIQPIKNAIQAFLNTLLTIVTWINTNVIQPILSIVVPIVTKIGEIIAKIWEIITVLFGVLCSWINTNVIQPIINAVTSFVNSIIQFFQNLWNTIVLIFSIVTTWINANIIQPVVTAITNFINSIIQFFQNLWNTIVLIFSIVTTWINANIIQPVVTAITNFINSIIQFFQNLWNRIVDIFSAVGNFFANVFTSAWNGIRNAFSGVTSFFQGIWNTIKNMFTSIGTTIGNGIGNAFKAVVNSIISFAENTINGFIRSINWAIDTINNIPGVNISRISELNIPRLKVGMANVPYDDYLALLHKGERVLTAKENREYTNGNEESVSNNNIDNSFNLTINSPKETSPAENARLLRREIQRYRLSKA